MQSHNETAVALPAMENGRSGITAPRESDGGFRRVPDTYNVQTCTGTEEAQASTLPQPYRQGCLFPRPKCHPYSLPYLTDTSIRTDHVI